jgi:Ran GTPase-activating protein (RanGAP) involved in mRNA processing and transport
LLDNTTLTTLHLRWNDIGKEGSVFLAEALRNNKTLTSLDVTNNNLGEEGRKSLRSMLDDNVSLTELIGVGDVSEYMTEDYLQFRRRFEKAKSGNF